VIRLEDVHKTYGKGSAANHVLRGVSLNVEAGEFVALMGMSGSGKSTLLNIVGALDQDYSGTVSIADQSLKTLSDDALSGFRNRTVSYIFQQFHLLAHLPVIDNVVMPSWFDPGRNADALRQVAVDVLGKVGLSHKVHARPAHLSGGEKQRVAIARALFNRPKVLLCDEPTGALDSETSDKVFSLIEQLNADGLTVVVVTHEPAIAERCKRTIHIRDGRIVTPAGEGE
jgi:putative ABC transport system ATP-binding protein